MQDFANGEPLYYFLKPGMWQLKIDLYSNMK